MKLRPPCSTLFPYTTLFRSVCSPNVTEINTAEVFLTSSDAAADRDRKSTRLNSSHVSISYAVFCLKKKKYGGRRQRRTDRVSHTSIDTVEKRVRVRGNTVKE